jgi:hypothetical protein
MDEPAPSTVEATPQPRAPDVPESAGSDAIQPGPLGPEPIRFAPVTVPGQAQRISATAHWLALAFLACILEGAMRKWPFHGSPYLVQGFFYFLKDLFLLGAALTGAQVSQRGVALVHLQQAWVLPTVLIVLASALTLGGVGLVGAFLSLRSLVVMPWMALMIASGLRSTKDIDYLVRLVAMAAVAIGLLGLFQFYQPADHYLNQQVEREFRAIPMGHRVRASGTFSFITGMANLAVLAIWAGTYLLLAHPRQTKWGVAGLLSGLVCASVTISRGALLGTLGILFASFVLSQRGRKYAVVFVVLVVVAWLHSSTEDTGEDYTVLQATIVRARKSEAMLGRIIHPAVEMISAVGDWPMGNGIGTAQMADRALSRGSRNFVPVETELGRIVYEIGGMGLLGVLLMRLSLVMILWELCFSAHQTLPSLRFRPLRLVSLVTLGLMFVGNLAYDHIASTFACIIMAVVLSTLDLETHALIVNRRRAHPAVD